MSRDRIKSESPHVHPSRIGKVCPYNMGEILARLSGDHRRGSRRGYGRCLLAGGFHSTKATFRPNPAAASETFNAHRTKIHRGSLRISARPDTQSAPANHAVYYYMKFSKNHCIFRNFPAFISPPVQYHIKNLHKTPPYTVKQTQHAKNIQIFFILLHDYKIS